MNNEKTQKLGDIEGKPQKLGDIEAKSQRFGYVAIVGAPNAGKSTLINQLIKAPLMGVHHKEHTTRHSILGVMTDHEKNTQVGLLDTVGIVNKPLQALEKRLHQKNIWQGANEANLVIWVVSLTDFFSERHQEMTPSTAPLWVIFNKRDKVNEEEALDFMNHFRVFENDVSFFYSMSALKENPVNKLRDMIFAAMPQGEWKYDEKCVSPSSRIILAEQITREVVMDYLHDEIPYDVTIETEEWSQNETGYVVRQNLYVSRTSRKGMVVGKGGQNIKRMSQTARQKIHMRLNLDQPLHFFLMVYVREDNKELRSIEHPLLQCTGGDFMGSGKYSGLEDIHMVRGDDDDAVRKFFEEGRKVCDMEG